MEWTKEHSALIDEAFDTGYAKSKHTMTQFLINKDLILPKLKVGEWYKLTQDYMNRLKSGLVFPFKEYQSPLHRYATVIHSIYLDTPLDGSGKDYLSPPSSNLVPATNQEVLEALTKEANKRYDFKKDTITSMLGNDNLKLSEQKNYFCFEENEFRYGNALLMSSKGKWATIVDEPNQELEALKKKYQELGKEIENLENK